MALLYLAYVFKLDRHIQMLAARFALAAKWSEVLFGLT